jgi:hypothetical protein
MAEVNIIRVEHVQRPRSPSPTLPSKQWNALGAWLAAM